jgi:dipeptidyl aminopeptidase/acylaminoacyl peptidase
MISCMRACAAIVWMSVAASQVQAAPPPIAAFAKLSELTDVSISPDGQRLAMIGAIEGRSSARVIELVGDKPARVVLTSELDRPELTWCHWANDTRLLCGYRGMVSAGAFIYIATRLVAVNADGSGMKVLVQSSRAAGSQFQDNVIDWTPDDPDTVLVLGHENTLGIAAHIDPSASYAGASNEEDPGVYRLNVYTGGMQKVVNSHSSVYWYGTDQHGNVRLSVGLKDATYSYYALLDGESSWRRLARMEAFGTDVLKPVGMAAEPNTAYAVGPSGDRQALWKMDLADNRPPELIFEHPLADVEPLLREDGSLIGVYYETDRPFIYYTDPYAEAIVRAAKNVLPHTFNTVIASSRDSSRHVVVARSDVEPGRFFLYDAKAGQLRPLGSSYTALDRKQLAEMRSVTYQAKDGTAIPGYLSVPVDSRAEHLPLIVMPHGGPIARDSWEFDFLRQFLVSRGYAVLQMNFRGSSGYGDKWFHDAHQDWGGLTYSDITDGAKWAVDKGIADPNRLCIVGWSFGGYAALLGAVRNSDIYKCAASIAGVSDLQQLLAQRSHFDNYKVSRLQIGTDSEKIANDSPARHAADVRIPVLMIHGDMDAQANIKQSEVMASALKRAGKPYQFIKLKGATHQLGRESDRTTLLTELENFLQKNIGAAKTGS